MKRAETAKEEMEKSLEAEKTMLKTFPYSEETLEKTLEIMKKKSDADQAKAAKR